MPGFLSRKNRFPPFNALPAPSPLPLAILPPRFPLELRDGNAYNHNSEEKGTNDHEIKGFISSIVTIATMFLLTGYGTTNRNPWVSGTPRQMESLGRGVVAVNQGDGKVFVSWRMLGTDPDDIAFHVYRVTGDGQPVRLNQEPITKASWYQDNGADHTRDNAWFVRPVVNGAEGQMSKPFLNKIAANAPVQFYLRFP